MRQVHFADDDVWGYKIGQKNVVIQSPDGKKTVVAIGAVGGGPRYTEDDYGETETSTRPVTPSMIKAYIEKNRLDLG